MIRKKEITCLTEAEADKIGLKLKNNGFGLLSVGNTYLRFLRTTQEFGDEIVDLILQFNKGESK